MPEILQHQPGLAILLVGFVLKLIGFAVRDMLYLRALVATGLICDVIFYATLDAVLWGPVTMNSVTASINVILIGALLLERTRLGMSAAQRRLHGMLPDLLPGHVRRLSRIVRWVREGGVLCHEGREVEMVHVLPDCPYEVTKGGVSAGAEGPAFIGEIALLTGASASATVRVPAGVEVAAFPMEELRRTMLHYPRLSVALTAAIGRDLARKTTHSLPIAPMPQGLLGELAPSMTHARSPAGSVDEGDAPASARPRV